jgi:hypothetical protein
MRWTRGGGERKYVLGIHICKYLNVSICEVRTNIWTPPFPCPNGAESTASSRERRLRHAIFRADIYLQTTAFECSTQSSIFTWN